MTSRVLIPIRRATQPSQRLIMFPYGGGTAVAYQRLAGELAPDVDCVAVEYPGHGRRRMEEPLMQVNALAQEVVRALSPSNVPLAFFGHSLGAAVAFEAARLLRAAHGYSLRSVIVSGRGAPTDPSNAVPSAPLSDAALTERIIQLGGTPPEVLADPDVLSLVMPAMRADFYSNENYVAAVSDPIDVPLFVYSGNADDYTNHPGLQRWRLYTRGGCEFRSFDGGHFFIDTLTPLVAAAIAGDLAPCVVDNVHVG